MQKPPAILAVTLALVAGHLQAASASGIDAQVQAQPPAALESSRLVLGVEKNGVMVLRDKLAKREWRQVLTEKGVRIEVDRIETVSPVELRLHLRTQERAFRAAISLVADGREVEVALTGEELGGRLMFPFAFLPPPESSLILAMKEGLAIPVGDTTVFFDHQKRGGFQFFEGHNAAMPFWGFANPDGSGLMTLVLTPNDAGFQISRRDGRLTDQVAWEAEFGRLGYPRKLRYVPLASGGYVAMAQRYRAQAEQDGLVKTLKEKIRANPAVERLLGAADVWFLDFRHEVKDSAVVARELQQLGITRAIFAGGGGWWTDMAAGEITAVNALGYLSGRYDCLQDVMAATNFPNIAVNPVYPPLQKAWPDDVVLAADGTPIKGWPVSGKGGRKYYCGRLSDRVRLEYARELIPRDLAAKPYLARFLDTEAATAWTEDYHPRHRATRSEARAARMQVLDFLSGESRLVTGSEGLSAYAVPHVDYFEGVSPVEPFRISSGEHPFKTFPADYDWGTNVTRLLEVSHRYQIPLWQLVFHDCVVAYPRWNEANNKYANPLWETKQALFCALGGRPPIFMFDVKWWGEPANRRRLAEIYRRTGPLAQQVGTARMIDHLRLDAAGDVQRTRFDNGVTVTVNFGHTPCTTAEGAVMAPFDCLVTAGQASPEPSSLPGKANEATKP